MFSLQGSTIAPAQEACVRVSSFHTSGARSTSAFGVRIAEAHDDKNESLLAKPFDI